MKKIIFLALDAVLAITIICFLVIKPPEEIHGLSVDSTTYNTVSLTWDKSKNATGYDIYRSENGSDFEFLEATKDTGFTDKDLDTGKTYTYKVNSRNIIKKTNTDTLVSAVPSLDKPKVRGTVSDGKVELSINNVEGAEGYKVYRDDEEIKTIYPEDNENVVFIDEEAEYNEEHTYKVTAVRNDAESKPSKKLDLLLISIGEITAETDGEYVYLNWEYDHTYAYYKLYKDDEFLAETAQNNYSFKAEEGTFDIGIIGYNDEGQSPESIKKYKISEEPMDNQDAIDAACEWGVMIADDDSFTYGTGERAHKNGCYFCGTNKKKKGTKLVNGHSYEKTYCCNTFVTACFAHGAGDEGAMALCENGNSLDMTEKCFQEHGDWEALGKPDASKLQKGDVLVGSRYIGKSKSHHMAIYLGDGMIVHARRSGWDPDSIAVTKMSAKRYGKFDFVMRYKGTGSGSVLKLTDITDTAEDDRDSGIAEISADTE